MREKLIEYGFAEWQIDELMKKKKLDTPHGVYVIKNGLLLLGNNLAMDLRNTK